MCNCGLYGLIEEPTHQDNATTPSEVARNLYSFAWHSPNHCFSADSQTHPQGSSNQRVMDEWYRFYREIND